METEYCQDCGAPRTEGVGLIDGRCRECNKAHLAGKRKGKRAPAEPPAEGEGE